MNKINVGVVGFGYWGPNLVRNFLSHEDIGTVVICDLSQKRLLHASKMYPHITRTDDVQTLLKDPTIDLIAIATPLSTHYHLAKRALLAGKHVLLEKPMTDSVDHSQKLISLSEKVQKKLFVGHTFVYSEPVRYLKKLLDSRSLGDIYYYDSTRINLGLLQSDTNVLWDLAPHDFSIIRYLFSEKPLWIHAVGNSFLREKVEELVHIFLQLENNILCHMQLSWLSPIKMRNIIIGGSKKMITFDDIEPVEKIKIYDKGVDLTKDDITPFLPAYRSGDIRIPSIPQKEALTNEISHFVTCITRNTTPLTGGHEGLQVVTLIAAAQKSLKTGKKVLFHD